MSIAPPALTLRHDDALPSRVTKSLMLVGRFFVVFISLLYQHPRPVSKVESGEPRLLWVSSGASWKIKSGDYPNDSHHSILVLVALSVIAYVATMRALYVEGVPLVVSVISTDHLCTARG